LELTLKEEKQFIKNSNKEIRFIKIWSLKDGDLDLFLKKEFPESQILYIQISDRSFSLLIINGKVSPFILDNYRWELWKINGLGKDFENTGVIEVNNLKIKISRVIGDADIMRMWILDFSDPKQGLKIEYCEMCEY